MGSRISSSPPLDERARSAKISRVGESVVGLCLYLSPEDLARLGVTTDDLDAVEYQIDNSTGQLTIRPVLGDCNEE